MSTYKYIFWRPDMKSTNKDGDMFANVHLLVGYNQRSISDFQNMAAALRETFPDVSDEDLICGQVHKSNYCYGFTLLSYNAKIPRNKDYAGWVQSTWLDGKGGPEYSY